jgi:hypothetical protein
MTSTRTGPITPMMATIPKAPNGGHPVRKRRMPTHGFGFQKGSVAFHWPGQGGQHRISRAYVNKERGRYVYKDPRYPSGTFKHYHP